MLRSKAGWSERLPRGQRVLDGLPGARVGGPLKVLFRDETVFSDSEAVPMEMNVPNVALIP